MEESVSWSEDVADAPDDPYHAALKARYERLSLKTLDFLEMVLDRAAVADDVAVEQPDDTNRAAADRAVAHAGAVLSRAVWAHQTLVALRARVLDGSIDRPRKPRATGHKQVASGQGTTPAHPPSDQIGGRPHSPIADPPEPIGRAQSGSVVAAGDALSDPGHECGTVCDETPDAAFADGCLRRFSDHGEALTGPAAATGFAGHDEPAGQTLRPETARAHADRIPALAPG